MLDAELQQGGVGSRLDVGLGVSPVVHGRIGRQIAFAQPGLRQPGEVSQCVHLGSLGARFSAGEVLAVEGMGRIRDAHGGTVDILERRRERRLGHGHRARVREFVDLRAGLTHVKGAAHPGSRTLCIAVAALVALLPGAGRRQFDRLRPHPGLGIGRLLNFSLRCFASRDHGKQRNTGARSAINRSHLLSPLARSPPRPLPR